MEIEIGIGLYPKSCIGSIKKKIHGRYGAIMAGIYTVVARVISQQGTCTAGHRVGDEFFIDDTTSDGICSWAFYTIFPFATTLQYKGYFPWENDRGKAIVACPDPANPVIFELRRVKK